MKQLYFVESITSNPDTSEVAIVLEKVGKENSQLNVNDSNDEFELHEFLQFPVLEDSKRRLEESHYVYFENGSFTSGKDNPLAIERRKLNSKLRREIIKNNLIKQNELSPLPVFTEHAEVHSYHVNVGHGNCTFILIQENGSYELWVVDCGEHDYLEKKNYRHNIDACLEDISEKLKIKLSDIRISRLLITHWHFDHISGINHLIKDKFVDSNTIVFANVHYGFSSKCANTLLDIIKTNNITCYEPTVALTSFSNITILYPECRIRRQPNLKDSGYRIVRDVNDSSVVYSIEIAGRRMIFPGDLEQDGWNSMTKNGNCCPYMQNCDFFCISHHGSITGHIDMKCMSSNTSVLSCCKTKCKKAIIMGRDKAYNCIYCRKVIYDFNPLILYSEKDTAGNLRKGFVLDWSRITVRYI